MEEVTDLPAFEGIEVMEATAAVRKAGDGLSEALHFAPFVIHKGETRFLVLQVECTDVQHPWIDKKDHAKGAVRKHILDASTGVFLDSKAVEKAIADQEKRLAKFRDEERVRKENEKGVFQFDGLAEEIEEEEETVVFLAPVAEAEEDSEPF